MYISWIGLTVLILEVPLLGFTAGYLIASILDFLEYKREHHDSERDISNAG